MGIFSRENTSTGWDTVMLQGTKRDWRLRGAVTAGGKQRGKKPQAGTPFSVFNTTAKAPLQGRSIEIPGG